MILLKKFQDLVSSSDYPKMKFFVESCLNVQNFSYIRKQDLLLLVQDMLLEQEEYIKQYLATS